MNIEIKQFHELSGKEVYEILQLRHDVFIMEQCCPYRDMDGEDFHGWHLQLRDGEVLVGYLRILPKEEVQIGRVVVREQYRRKKMAQKMLREAKEFILERYGERKLFLEAQLYAMPLYAQVGFVPVGELFLEDGIAHQRMEYVK